MDDNTITLGLKETGLKNIVISGGCACVANYEYLKHLPKGVKMFVDPLCQDAGTSVGLANIFIILNNEKVKKLVIVGGGTAGWITASWFARRWRSLEVVVIDKSDPERVGVGEAC